MMEINKLSPAPEGSVGISCFEALENFLCPVAFTRFLASPACLLRIGHDWVAH